MLFYKSLFTLKYPMKIEINPKKIIVIMILLSISLFATDHKLFLLKVKTLIYKNNTSQQALKESFEKLVPDYLEIEGLFSKEACQTDSSSNIALAYNNFFKLLQLYTNYLRESGSKEEYLELVDKNLKIFHSLMQNSDNLIDYIISLNQMHQLLMSLNCSNELREILKKYPPQNQEILFEKLELEKKRKLTMWREKGMKRENITTYTPERIKRLNEEVAVELQNILTQISKLETIAIKDSSEDSLTRYKRYIQKVTNLSKYNAILEKAKYKGSVYIIKVLDFFGIESDFRGTTIDKIVTTLLAMMVVPHSVEINSKNYQQHKELMKRYEMLLNGC